MTGSLSTSVSITVLKPTSEVFAAVLTPVPFFVAQANAPMAAGKTSIWNFPEIPNVNVPVEVEAVEPGKLVRFFWEGMGGEKNRVEFAFAPLDAGGRALAGRLGIPADPATTVTVTESGWPDTPDGHKAALGNTMGWTQMLCALKAHLENGVNLRRGAFLHYKF